MKDTPSTLSAENLTAWIPRDLGPQQMSTSTNMPWTKRINSKLHPTPRVVSWGWWFKKHQPFREGNQLSKKHLKLMKEVVDFPRNPCVLPVHRQLPEKPAISTSAEEEVEKKGGKVDGSPVFRQIFGTRWTPTTYESSYGLTTGFAWGYSPAYRSFRYISTKISGKVSTL